MSNPAQMGLNEALSIIENQKRIIAALQHETDWYQGLIFNPSYNEVDMRLMVATVPREIRMGYTSESPEKKIYAPALAEEVHASPKTVTKRIKRLEDAGIYSYRLSKDDDTGNTRSHLQVLEAAGTPATVEIERAPEGGSTWQDGKRVTRCKDCGSANLQKVSQVICADCGSPQTEKTYKPVNDPNCHSDTDPPDGSDDTPNCHSDTEGETGEIPKLPSLTVYTEPAIVPGDTLANPPAFLRRKAIWVCWRWGPDDNGKPTKVPFIANNLGKQKASVSDLTTWRAHAYAIAVYEQSQERQGTFTDNKGVEYTYRFDGIGFMCDGTFTFLDQDHCCNPETGEIDAVALERARSINSYTEPSVSGHGLHTYAEGTIEANRKHQGVEMYSTVRFCVYTGCPLPDFPQEVESRQDELRALHCSYFPARAEYLWSIEPDDTDKGKSDDEMEQLLADVKARMARAKNAEKCMKLWAGDCSDYANDHSRADAAFCKMLAHYVGKSVSIIDWLFRKSGLMRPKWERADYRKRTFRYAFSGEQIAS